LSTDAIIWDDSGGDTICQRCGGCGCPVIPVLQILNIFAKFQEGHSYGGVEYRWIFVIFDQYIGSMWETVEDRVTVTMER